MPNRVFSVDELEDMEVAYNNVSSKGCGKRRWSETFEVVFEFDNRFYRVYVEEGHTEYQDYTGTDRYPDAIAEDGAWYVVCPEVEKYVEMVPVTQWKAVG